MACRDRTAEFIATVNSKREKPQWIQQKSSIVNSDNMQTNRLANDVRYREFMKMSKDCAFKLSASYEKVERLTKLASQRNVFGDTELNKLVADIRRDISELKRQVDDLTARQSPKQIHSKNIVTSLQQRLADMSSSFKSTLETRSKTVQEQTARQGLYVVPVSNTSQINTSYNYTQSNNGLSVINMDGSSQNHSMQLVPQQLQASILQNDDSYMMDRVNTMQTIESTIVELGTIFEQLATMVQAQDETIMRIDTNISETAGNVEAAHEALLRYFTSINNNRWLILKVFGILFFFFVLFVMFGT